MKKSESTQGKHNRNKILKELLESPSTFTKLQKKLRVSPKTLTSHLRSLLNEGLVTREIQGKYVKYVIVKPETVLQMRKDFLKELSDLTVLYDSCLNNETHNLFAKALEALQESIGHPEAEAETDRIFGKTMKVPKRFKGTVDMNLEEPYGKPKFEKSKPIPKRGRRSGKHES